MERKRKDEGDDLWRSPGGFIDGMCEYPFPSDNKCVCVDPALNEPPLSEPESRRSLTCPLALKRAH